MTVIGIKWDGNLREFSSELLVYTLKRSTKNITLLSNGKIEVLVDVCRPRDEVVKKN